MRDQDKSTPRLLLEVVVGLPGAVWELLTVEGAPAYAWHRLKGIGRELWKLPLWGMFWAFVTVFGVVWILTSAALGVWPFAG